MKEKEKVEQIRKTKFRDLCGLTSEELNDPDFRLKQLNELSQGKASRVCSKCGPDCQLEQDTV